MRATSTRVPEIEGDGPLHSVAVAHALLIRPAELAMPRRPYRLQ